MSTPTRIRFDAATTLDETARVVAGIADEISRMGFGVPGTQGSPSDADSREAYAVYGQAGLIGLHWPERFGGHDLDPLFTIAVEEQMGYNWLPMSSYLLSVKTIGNALLQYATEELCARFLPQIVAGDLVFCQGFSELSAGTDLASLRTVARRDGDNFIVNGHKIWTSSVEYADWIYLAVRTGGVDSRHRGLSVLIADMKSPGIDLQIHPTLGGGTLGEVTLTDVVIPVGQLIGDENAGWNILMGTLDYERVTTEKVGIVERLLDDLERIVQSSDGTDRISELRGEAQVARLHGQRATSRLAAGEDSSAESSMAKLSVAVLMQRLADAFVDLVGPAAHVESGLGSVLDGHLAAFYRAAVATTIAGGVSDIQRKNISRKRIGARA